MKTPKLEFEKLMYTIAEGWNEGNAHKSANCFTEDSVYIEPPDKQVYHGRAELYEFFGGDQGPEIPMHMTWHHLSYNEEELIGFGKYSFRMYGNYHGIVTVKLENGLIKFWREYQYKTELDWEEFSHLNLF
ncbi:MAG: nuclear transport factor 2 family protein [Anaerolineales bacterium]